MRIAFHVPRASHLKAGFSGDKILVRGLIEGLERRGHNVQIVSRLNIRNVWRGRVDRDELVVEMRRVRTEMEGFRPEAWIVYGASTTNPDLLGWWTSAFAISRPQTHLMLATDLGSGKRLPPRWRRLFAWAHRRSLRNADWISAYHPASRDELVEHGIARRRVLLLPPAVSPWKKVPSMRDARKQLGLPLERSVLFCASRIPSVEDADAGKAQMLLDLVTASKSLPPDAVLLIAGDGPGRGALEQAIASTPAGPAIRFVGPVEHGQMPTYFAACDFFVYPHRIDRPWLAVLEAQSCGRPVVTMQTRSSEMTVCPGQTGLLASGPADFQQAIGALARDRQQARSMGRAAATYVAQHHSLEVRLDQIEALLREPLDKRPVPQQLSSGSQHSADGSQPAATSSDSTAGVEPS